jgi:hypothetical protein
MRPKNAENEVRFGAAAKDLPEGSPQPRRPQIVGALAMIALGVLLALIVAEFGLRLLGVGEEGMYQWDADRGWALRPGASEWQRKEGHAFVQINHEGMHDREHFYSKPADTIRIAFIGDSFTEAEQVAIQDDFVSVVERRLGNCARLRGRKVEALNFGCDSYGTAQELITLKHDVWKFAPDFIVLLFFAGNDLRNNALGLEWHHCQPFYALRGDQLVLTGPFLDSPVFHTRCMIKFESRRSAVLNVIGDSLSRLRAVAKAKKELPREHRAKTFAPSVELGLDHAIYLPPQSPDWEIAWNVTEKLLLAFSQDVKEHGAQFLVVTASVGPQVYPNPLWRAKYAKNLAVSDLFYPERRITEDGERGGFPVLNLAPVFQSFADQNHVFLHGFANTKLGTGHWNEAGHRLAGRLIADRLCDLIAPASGNGPAQASIGASCEPNSSGRSRSQGLACRERSVPLTTSGKTARLLSR